MALRTPDDTAIDRLLAGYAAGASIRELALSSHLSRAQVRAALLAAGYVPAPRGAGRPRHHRRHVVPAEITDQIRDLYVEHRLPRRRIAEKLDLAEHTVRTTLDRIGVDTRTRGGFNREDRTRIPANVLRLLYERQQLTVAQVAARLNSTPAVVSASLHEHGIPVRRPTWQTPPEQVCVLNELYADAVLLAVLRRHGVPRRSRPGGLASRFPEPVPLTVPLLHDLYVECGLSAKHIELLTGQPSVQVYRHLAAHGVPRRPAGGLSPWRRRLLENKDGDQQETSRCIKIER